MDTEVEEEIMGILFGEEIRCLDRDDFDGTNEEHRVYMEVLYKSCDGNLSNASSKMMKFHSGSSLKGQSGDAESSVHIFHSSLKDTSADTSVHARLNVSLSTLMEAGNECFPAKNDINLATPDSVTANPKLQYRVVESLGNGVLSCLYFDNFQSFNSASDDYVSTLSRINQEQRKVKVFKEATSRTSMSKQNHFSAASKPDLGCIEVPVGMLSCVDFSASTRSLMVQSESATEENVLECGITKASMETPFREDLQVHCGSYPASKKDTEFNAPDIGTVSVLVHDYSMKCVSPCSNSLVLRPQRSTEPHVVGSDVVELVAEDIPTHSTKRDGKPTTRVLSINKTLSWEQFSTRDLAFGLRSYARHLLKDADWKIRIHKRMNPNRKPKLDYYYLSPDGLTLSSLPKAWVACGSRLISSSQNAGGDDDTGRTWVDIDEFWSELANVLAHVKKKFWDLEKSVALLHQWRILDPFIAVLCINMKVSALKDGKVVKAARSEAVVLSNNKRLFLASKAVDKLQDHTFPRNLSHPVQLVSSDDRLQVTECSNGQQFLPLLDKKNLKRKRWHCKLFDRTSRADNRTSKRKPRTIGKIFSNDMDYSGLNHSLSSGNDMPSEDTMMIDGSSKPGCLNPFERFSIHSNGSSSRIDKSPSPDCFNSLENSSIQMDNSNFIPIDKFNPENDTLSKSRIDLEVHPIGTPCSFMNEYDKEKTQNDLGVSIRSLSFQETDEIGDGSDFKPINSNCNTNWRNEEPAEVRQQSMAHSGNTSNVLKVNLVHEHPMAGQEILLFYPREKKDCFNHDGYYRGELIGHFVSPCDLEGNVQQEIHSHFCGSGILDISHLFGSSNNTLNDAGFSFQVGSINFGSQDEKMIQNLAQQGTLKKHVCPKHGNGRPLSSESMIVNAKKQTTSSITPRQKRSKTISEIQFRKSSVKKCKNNIDKVILKSHRISKIPGLEAAEVNANRSKSNANCMQSCPFSMDHRKNDLHYLGLQGKVNNLRVDLFSAEENSPHENPMEMSSRVETEQTNFKAAPNNFNDFSLYFGTLEAQENSSRLCFDKIPDEALILSRINNKEADEVEKPESGRKQCRKNNNENHYNLMSDNIVDSLEPQHIEALMPDPGNPQGMTAVKKTGIFKKRGRKKKHRGHLKSDNLSSTRGRNFESEVSRELGRLKRSCSLVHQSLQREGQTSVNAKEAPKGARTVLRWLINMGVISLSDTLQYRTPRKMAVVKEGRITKAGILCKCCKKVFSVTSFKLHAGCKVQKPSLNLFLKSGKPYIFCQLEAWSIEYNLRKDDLQTKRVEDGENNDDTCRLCADGGDLVCCDSCPFTYHQACLFLQELPEGSWYCPSCSCAICSCVLNSTADSLSIATIECSQCEQRYHETCIIERIRYDAAGSKMWFCGQKCLQVYVGLHSLIGLTKCSKDGFSWSILKCNHVDKKISSVPKTALMAECNAKLAIALSIMEESFLPMLDPRTGNNMIPQFFYNWGSDVAQVNYQGFYTVALEKDDELFSVALIRVHGVTLAEMPLIATCIGQRRKGMCRRLVHVIEEMLKLLKVEMLVLPAIPCLVDTWISAFGFKHVSDYDKKKLSTINLMIFPGATLLKKNLCEGGGRELGREDNLPLKEYPSMERTVDIQAPVAGISESNYSPSNSFSIHSVCTEQHSRLKNNCAGSNYGLEAAEDTNLNGVLHNSEKDPFSEALNSYKSSLGEINNINILGHA